MAAALSVAACGSDDASTPAQPEADGGVLPDGETPVDEVCSAGGWCWDSPYPQGNDLPDVWAFSADSAWFVGPRGTILHYDQGHWQAAVSPTTRDLKAIWAAGPSDIWAVGAHANVLHYDGEAWTLEHGTAADPEPVDADAGDGGVEAGPEAAADAAEAGDAAPPGLPEDKDLLAIHGRTKNDIWVAGASGTIVHYDGSSWIAEEGVTPRTLRGVWAGPSDTVYAVGDTVVLAYDGEVWASVNVGTARNWTSIDATTEDDIWVTGNSNRVIHFDGKAWAESTLSANARTIVAGGTGSAWAFGDQGMAWHWDGEAWTSVSTGTRENLLGSSRYGSDRFLVSGSGGTVIRWENGSRQSLIESFESNFLAIGGSAPDDIWVVGDTVLQGTEERWTEAPPPVTRSLFGVWAGGEDNVWAVGTAGTILGRSLIGWVVTGSPTEEWLRAVWCANAASGWVVGDKGTVLGLLNGTAWAKVPSATTSDLYAVWGPSAAEAWAVGDKGTIIHWDKGEWQLAAVELGDAGTPFRTTLHAVWGSASSDVWAVGSLGSILHYNGSSWRVAAGGGEETLNAVWGRSATDVWTVGTSGTVLHYDGSAWTASASGTSVDLRGVWGLDDGTVWIVGDHGAVLRRVSH